MTSLEIAAKIRLESPIKNLASAAGIIAVLTSDGMVSIWDQMMQPMTRLGQPDVEYVAISSDANYIALVTNTAVTVWHRDMQNVWEIGYTSTCLAAANGIRFDAENRLAILTLDNQITFCDIETSVTAIVRDLGIANVTVMDFFPIANPKCDAMVVANMVGELQVFCIDKRDDVANLKVASGITAVSCGPRHSEIIIAFDTKIHVYSFNMSQSDPMLRRAEFCLRAVFTSHVEPIMRLDTFLPGYLLSVGRDNHLKIWHLELNTLHLHWCVVKTDTPNARVQSHVGFLDRTTVVSAAGECMQIMKINWPPYELWTELLRQHDWIQLTKELHAWLTAHLHVVAMEILHTLSKFAKSTPTEKMLLLIMLHNISQQRLREIASATDRATVERLLIQPDVLQPESRKQRQIHTLVAAKRLDLLDTAELGCVAQELGLAEMKTTILSTNMTGSYFLDNMEGLIANLDMATRCYIRTACIRMQTKGSVLRVDAAELDAVSAATLHRLLKAELGPDHAAPDMLLQMGIHGGCLDGLAPEVAMMPDYPAVAKAIDCIRTRQAELVRPYRARPPCDTLPKAFLCPLTLQAMADPVAAADGYYYERSTLADWMPNHAFSPMTLEPWAYQELHSNPYWLTMCQLMLQV